MERYGCAVDVQRAFDARIGSDGEEPVRVRIGLHTGEAIEDAGDFFGKNVVLASRIADAASGGEILVSSELRRMVTSLDDVRLDAGRELELKGLAGRHRVFGVVWESPR